ncbi:branched-chain amino acid transaminase [Legionella jordanis]|uniref:Branched-chain-amino-acid aminotransferase n=1 Tax=Legionella jordanis TaxID=456 RepID=A0A0W0VAI9_9GAMM|nr:branched-chain amino acid transaminase [Legionella jordanis]KTD17114.1 D-alanine-aminotransferase [Legionella jordanis]RMX03245.1 branched-chain amino acid transaminase [Legionella jordanis]RMX18223.1 branched-chain amino acid transaminase [Legionella jordanis]VEH12689.1 D-alanine transaminase [Legionella jordanis]HAT8713162.1 branched-chain amino acid transaminase [Legionella jordanis]
MLNETEIIWQNGKLIPWAEAKIHILSHSVHYGGGAFEGIRFYQTEDGPAIFRLQDHVERLFFSSNVLKMNLPYTLHEVSEAIIEVVRSNKIECGYIRPIAFYGYGKMGVNPVGNPVELFIACWPWGAYLPHDAIDVKISSYIHVHPDSTVVQAKLCGHYVNGILASLEIQGTPYHEALFVDSNGFITEGVGENFFMVKNGIIHTPKLGGILPGITRDTIIRLARDLNLQVLERDIPVNEVYEADEAFFTGTAAEVTGIRSIDDRVLGASNQQSITAAIKQAYFDLVRGKNKALEHYLTYVNSGQTERQCIG